MGNIVATLGAGVVKPVTHYPTSSGPLVELVAQEHARPTDQLQYPQCISTSPVRTQTTATEPQSKRTNDEQLRGVEAQYILAKNTQSF